MRYLKRLVTGAFALAGMEIHRLPDATIWTDLGQDPFQDMKRLVGTPRPTILDVGANEGQTIKEFCKAFDSPVIHAFEPGAGVFQKLQAATASIPNLKLNCLALGSAREGKLFQENSQSVMSRFLKRVPGDGGMW